LRKVLLPAALCIAAALSAGAATKLVHRDLAIDEGSVRWDVAHEYNLLDGSVAIDVHVVARPPRQADGGVGLFAELPVQPARCVGQSGAVNAESCFRGWVIDAGLRQ
jgi:hypothetical protein